MSKLRHFGLLTTLHSLAFSGLFTHLGLLFAHFA
jgi:hypothetical protein